MKLLLINPNTSAATLAMMLDVARGLLPGSVEIAGVCAAFGPPMIVDAAALAAAATEVAGFGRLAGIDAVIVAAFGDPGVAALQAANAVPVIGIGAAAMQEAAATGRRFGIVTTTPGLAGAIEAQVTGLGLAGRFTGLRLTEGGVALPADPAALIQALERAMRDCIDRDGAQAVIVGGGPLAQAAAALRHRFPAEIVEPVPAAIRQALALLRPVAPP